MEVNACCLIYLAPAPVLINLHPNLTSTTFPESSNNNPFWSSTTHPIHTPPSLNQAVPSVLTVTIPPPLSRALSPTDTPTSHNSRSPSSASKRTAHYPRLHSRSIYLTFPFIPFFIVS